MSKVDIASPGTNPGIFHDRRYISSQVVGRLAEGFTVARRADWTAPAELGALTHATRRGEVDEVIAVGGY